MPFREPAFPSSVPGGADWLLGQTIGSVLRAAHFDSQRFRREGHQPVRQALGRVEEEGPGLPRDQDFLQPLLGATQEYSVLQAGRALDAEGQVAGLPIPDLGDPLAAPEVNRRVRWRRAQAEELESLARDGDLAERLVNCLALDGSGEPLWRTSKRM